MPVTAAGFEVVTVITGDEQQWLANVMTAELESIASLQADEMVVAMAVSMAGLCAVTKEAATHRMMARCWRRTRGR